VSKLNWIEIVRKLKGTHRIRTHAVLLLTLTLTFDLSTQDHVICRISEGHSLYQVWTLSYYSFLSDAADISVNPNLSSDLDLSTQNHTTCRISQGHFLYQVRTLSYHSVLSYAPDMSVKNALFDPVILTFESQNSNTSNKMIPYNKFKHFWMIRCFWVKLRTNRQIDSKILSHADRHSRHG